MVTSQKKNWRKVNICSHRTWKISTGCHFLRFIFESIKFEKYMTKIFFYIFLRTVTTWPIDRFRLDVDFWDTLYTECKKTLSEAENHIFYPLFGSFFSTRPYLGIHWFWRYWRSKSHFFFTKTCSKCYY